MARESTRSSSSAVPATIPPYSSTSKGRRSKSSGANDPDSTSWFQPDATPSTTRHKMSPRVSAAKFFTGDTESDDRSSPIDIPVRPGSSKSNGRSSPIDIPVRSVFSTSNDRSSPIDIPVRSVFSTSNDRSSPIDIPVRSGSSRSNGRSSPIDIPVRSWSSKPDDRSSPIDMRSGSSTPTAGTPICAPVGHLEYTYKATKKKHNGQRDPIANIFIRFQLRGLASEPGRIFQTNDIDVLFQRARDFYDIPDGRLALWCSPPGVNAVRYIFVGEGGTNEFRILQTLVYNAGVIDKNILVEVRPHKPAVDS
ncbi:hypothetical protein N7535_007487 [Penicillium sp. DV-2018c]|nr:hypothetical protein N7461_003514 [Penicillium sp. DV-2018c]KAJ5565849.1 hypothetical protein N7535_007487 [Penicillium sp. DV-2018c]